MKVVLFLGAALLGLYSAGLMFLWPSSANGDVAADLLMSAAVLFGAAAIVDAIERAGERLLSRLVQAGVPVKQ